MKQTLYILISLCLLFVYSATLSAQSPLLRSGFKVPETIKVGEVKEILVPASADLEAIRTILNNAIASSSTTHTTLIKFAAGAEYHIGGASEKTMLNITTVSGKKPTNIIFDGQGCKFVVTSRSRFCYIANYSNVMMRNFELDYEPGTSSHGVISEWDKNTSTCIVTLREGATPLDHEYYKEAGLLWVNPMECGEDERWRIVDKTPTIIQFRVREKISDSKFKVWFWAQHSRPFENTPSPLLHNIKNGMDMAFQARNTGHVAFYLTDGNNMTMRDITVWNSLGAITDDKWGNNTAYYNVRTNPGGKRIWGGNADGFYFVGHRNGPWIENCELTTVADDAVVVKNNTAFLIEKNEDSATPYTFNSPSGKVDFYVGDSITIYDVSTRKLVSQHVVTASNVKIPTSTASINTQPAITIAPNDKNMWVYNMSSQCNGFVLKDSEFHDHRRWSVLCQAAHASIVGNKFMRSQCAAIVLTNAPSGGEGSETGGIARNVEIRDNHFEENWHSYNVAPYAVIDVQMQGNDAVTDEDEEYDTKGDWNGIENIQIVNNTFKNWHMMSALTPFVEAEYLEGHEVNTIYLRDVNNAVVTGNTFEMEGTIYDALFKKDVDENNGDKIIRLVDCKNTANYGNTHGNDVPASLDEVQNERFSVAVQNGVLAINTKEEQVVNVYALDGRVVRSKELVKGKNVIEGLTAGVYLLGGLKVVI